MSHASVNPRAEVAEAWIDRLLSVADRREKQLAEALDEVERLRGENTRLQTKIDAARLLIADSYETGGIDGADLFAALDVEPSKTGSDPS